MNADIMEDNGIEAVFTDFDYGEALIGSTIDVRAVYDFTKMVEWLVENENMKPDEAADYICWNNSFHRDELEPVVMFPVIR